MATTALSVDRISLPVLGVYMSTIFVEPLHIQNERLVPGLRMLSVAIASGIVDITRVLLPGNMISYCQEVECDITFNISNYLVFLGHVVILEGKQLRKCDYMYERPNSHVENDLYYRFMALGILNATKVAVIRSRSKRCAIIDSLSPRARSRSSGAGARESRTNRQPFHNRLSQPIKIVHHFNPKFLAHNLHISPLPEPLGTDNDSLARNARTDPKLEQTDGRLGSWVEVNDDNVGLVLLVEFPLHLFAVGGKIDVLAPRAVPIGAVRIVHRDGNVGERGG